VLTCRMPIETMTTLKWIAPVQASLRDTPPSRSGSWVVEPPPTIITSLHDPDLAERGNDGSREFQPTGSA